MQAVAEDLAAGVPSRRGRMGWLAAAVLLSFGALGVLPRSAEVATDPCDSVLLPPVVSASTRSRAAVVVDPTEFEPELTRYAEAFAQDWAAACATAGDAGRLERSCLQIQRGRIEAALGHVADGVLDVEAFRVSMPSPSDCAAEILGSNTPAPAPGIADEVQSLRGELVVAEEQLRAGLYEEAKAGFAALRPRTQALGYQPLHAEVVYWQAIALDDADAARPLLIEAAQIAVASSHHSVAARAWLGLMRLELVEGAVDFERVDEYARMARGALDALGDTPAAASLEALWALRVAYRYSFAGDEDEAL